MPRRSPYEEDYEYDDEDYEDRKGPRRFKKEDRDADKKKRWERESDFDRDNDYDERR